MIITENPDVQGLARRAKGLGIRYFYLFWDEAPLDFTVEQKQTGLGAGAYELGSFLQGGDAGSSSVFELYVTVNGEKTVVQSNVNGWLKWSNPVISGIQVPDGAEVTAGVHVKAAGGAWGAWDDFYMYKEEQLP